MNDLPSSEKFVVRLARRDDLAAINDIYNHYVLHSTCTYQETAESMESRATWFDKHDTKHPVTVAEVDGKVVGWGSLSPYHQRSAYRFTVENSVYIHPEFHRRGIGSIILKDLIERTRLAGHHAIIALVDADQKASVTIHERFAFTKVGHLKQVGLKTIDGWM